MKTEANDPAYARADSAGKTNAQDGLTKREYFAAMAMQGAISGDAGWFDGVSYEALAKRSIEAADALIAELNK